MRISFVIPSRNNLKYLKQAVKSITDCYGTDHDLVLLDDASTDGTWEWINSLEGSHIVKYRNEGPERVGHTILYDVGVDISKTDVFSILHADMVVTPNYVPNLLKHLAEGKVVCATRIEPPLHPPGPEKFVKMYGFEPEEFKKDELLQFVEQQEKVDANKITKGIFAPWCMHKTDFQAIQGHDPLFAPMELEDSDIFNRMLLAGYELIQSRDSFVYHMTCRGSRFKDGIEIEAEIPLPDGTIWYKPKDSEEYKALRAVKFREWWRKWGCNVLHDDHMMPIVPHKYNIHAIIHNCNHQLLELLEPWFSTVYTRSTYGYQWADYRDVEQSNTKFDLSKRLFDYDPDTFSMDNIDILIEFDAKQLTNEGFQIIQQLSQIIGEQGEIGEFQLDIFKITITSLRSYEKNLISTSDPYYTSQLL